MLDFGAGKGSEQERWPLLQATGESGC